eukprot:SAG31_NODE_418_length_15893_cov_5.433899_12_plen_127_part_00
MVKSKIVDMAKREVRNDPGFTRVGLRNGTTWYYQDKEFTGIEDMVAYCCSLYEAHVGPDIWKLIKPSPEEMNPGEIAGILPAELFWRNSGRNSGEIREKFGWIVQHERTNTYISSTSTQLYMRYNF